MLVSVNEAAELLGVSAGHLRRRCATELVGRGIALHDKPPTGGKPKWFIDRRLDKRLAPGRVGSDQRAPDLSGYTKRQVHDAMLRAACVDAFNVQRSEECRPQARWLTALIERLRREHPGLRISRASLFNWHRVYRDPADLTKLIDARGGDTRTKGDPAAWKAFADYYLDDRQPSVKSCWSRVRDESRANRWAWCSYKGCARQLDSRIPPEVQVKHRDPRKWRSEMQPTIAQDTEAWAAGQCWVGDHKQMDIWCRVGKRLVRPWFTAWLDWRTRRMAGWCVSASPNSSTILAALRHGLTDPRNMGGPSVVWIDNGKDYDAVTFHGQTKTQRLGKRRIDHEQPQVAGLFKMLGIETHFSLAYNPNGKARVERWFRSLEGFFKSFTTYTGKSTHTRPESLKKILKDRRTVPTLDHVQDRLRGFIEGHNARTNHCIEDLSEDGVAVSPDQAMSAWCRTRRVMADPAALNLLMHTWHKPVTATRNGITINVAGKALRYGQFDPALSPFKGPRKQDRKPLMVSYDPHDVRSIRVYDDQYRFVAELALNDTGGRHGGDAISRDHVSSLVRRKRDYAKGLKLVADNRPTEYLTDAELLADELAAEHAPDRPDPTPNDGSLNIVQTPLDGASKDVERAEMRQAAGAEYCPPQDDDPIELDLAPRPSNDPLDDDLDPIELDTAAAFAGDDDELDTDVELDWSDPDPDGGVHLLDELR